MWEITRKSTIKVVHMRATGIKKDVKIIATNITNETKGSNCVGVFSLLQLRTGTDPVSETSCFYS
jgi:hypothetical protein